jgi:tape measure domain-containing protein
VTAETRKLDGAVRGANERLGAAKGKFVSMGSGAKAATGGISALTGAVKGLAIAAAAITAAKFIFVKTAELEKQARSLTVLTGSANKAKDIIQELRDFGSVTPFESIELIETAKRLKAFGVETEKLVDITKRLGDVAGATGADLGGITTAFGQIQAKGRLQTEELLQLQERGVDLAGVLREEYNLTGEEFSKALEKGQISAEAAEFALKKLTDTGGKYADGAIAQSTTLSGKFSTLLDGVGRLAVTIGDALKPAIDFVLTAAINATNQIIRLIEFSNKILGLGTENKIANLEQELEELEGGKRFRHVSQSRSDRIKELRGEIALLKGQVAPVTEQLEGLQDAANGVQPPALTTGSASLGASGGSAGRTRTKRSREQKDLTFEMNALLERQQQLAHSTDEIAKSKLAKEVEIQRILEAQLPPLKEQRALRDAEIAHERTMVKVYQDKFKAAAENNKVNLDGLKAIFEQGAMIDAQIEKQAQKMNQLYRSIGDTITSSIVDSLAAAVDGTKSLAEVASNTLRNLADIMLRFGLQTFLGGLGGGNPSSIFTKLFGGERASGGTVTGGRSFVVGERGPELFTPGRSGSIAPNKSLGGVNVGTINISVENTGEQLSPQAQKQLAGQVKGIVLGTLANERRSGGML